MEIATESAPQGRGWVRLQTKKARREARARAVKAAPRIEIRIDRRRAIEVPAPVAVIGLVSLAIAVILAAMDPASVRFAVLDREAAQLASWERHADEKFETRVDAIEEPLRELRHEALMRGIAPVGDLAQTPCDGPAESHLAGHLAEAAKLSAALAARHDPETAPESLLPSRSPIDLSADIPLTESRWAPSIVRVSSKQGERTDPFSGEEKEHRGIDIAAPLGTPVIAPAGGIVEFAGKVDPNVDHARSLLGNYVLVRHGTTGFTTIYAHLSRIDVKTGQTVHTGDRLGLVGSSGHSTAPHLHYQVMKDGVPVNPLAYIADVILVKDGKSVWYAKRSPEKKR